MRRIAIVLLVLAIAIGAASTFRLKLVRSGSGLAQLLWHQDEAFLFLVTGRGRWNVSGLWWLSAHFLTYGLGAATDGRSGMTVCRITPETIEKRDFDWIAASNLIAFDGAVSGSNGVPWTGDGFDTSRRRPVPKAFLELDQTLQHFSDVEGWSKRSFFLPPREFQRTVDFVLRGQPARLVLSVSDDVQSIDLERTGRPTERLWTADRRLRWVGAEEYEAFLKEPPAN
jgi:hypothetical protein